MKYIYFILAVFAVILALTSCDNGSYSIDNPTGEPIKVSIDGRDPIVLAAKELKKMDGTLSRGQHTMQIEGKEAITFNLDQDDIMLNPTLSTYITVVQEYGIGFQSSDNNATITIDDIQYEGPFPAVSNAPFIYTGDINFQVDTPIKKEIETSQTGTVTMRKLFRQSEFVEYYNAES